KQWLAILARRVSPRSAAARLTTIGRSGPVPPTAGVFLAIWSLHPFCNLHRRRSRLRVLARRAARAVATLPACRSAHPAGNRGPAAAQALGSPRLPGVRPPALAVRIDPPRDPPVPDRGRAHADALLAQPAHAGV